MNWPHGPAHWLFEPGFYIVTASTYRKLPHLNSPLRAGFLSGLLVQMRERIRLELARLGSVGQSLPLRCGVAARSSDATEISRQASHADGQTTQPLGQHAGTKSVVSILGEPYHLRALVSSAVELRSS